MLRCVWLKYNRLPINCWYIKVLMWCVDKLEKWVTPNYNGVGIGLQLNMPKRWSKSST